MSTSGYAPVRDLRLGMMLSHKHADIWAVLDATGTYGFVTLTGKPPKNNSGAQVLTVGQWGYWTDGYRYECVASNQIVRSAPESNY